MLRTSEYRYASFVITMGFCCLYVPFGCFSLAHGQYSSLVPSLTILHIVIFDLWITCLSALMVRVKVVTVDKGVDNSFGWCG
jgi:hypothetical protein